MMESNGMSTSQLPKGNGSMMATGIRLSLPCKETGKKYGSIWMEKIPQSIIHQGLVVLKINFPPLSVGLMKNGSMGLMHNGMLLTVLLMR
ncbi:hypothetical protein D3C85_1088210 [compost metagenome]